MFPVPPRSLPVFLPLLSCLLPASPAPRRDRLLKRGPESQCSTQSVKPTTTWLSHSSTDPTLFTLLPSRSAMNFKLVLLVALCATNIVVFAQSPKPKAKAPTKAPPSQAAPIQPPPTFVPLPVPVDPFPCPAGKVDEWVANLCGQANTYSCPLPTPDVPVHQPVEVTDSWAETCARQTLAALQTECGTNYNWNADSAYVSMCGMWFEGNYYSCKFLFSCK